MSDVYVTKHGEKRTKDRVGLSKKSAEKNAEKALKYGIKHSESSGGLNKYFSYLYFSSHTMNNIRIYNRYVYLFNGNTLVTVLTLPQKFRNTADKLQQKKKNSLCVEETEIEGSDI